MKVATRLYLAVVPAILGVLLVAALAYWGEYGREAPETIVWIAIVAAIASLITTWRNTRYVARRVMVLAQRSDPRATREAGSSASTDPPDELDEIEATVADLNTKLANERLAAKADAQRAEQRAADYAELLDGAVTTMSSNLEQARLPLHILLSSPFGALNENQEEMLDAAQKAVDAADAYVSQLRRLIEIDRSTTPRSPQRARLDDLLRAPLAIAKALAAQSAVQLTADIPETLLPVMLDTLRTQEALTVLITHAVAHTPPGGDVRVRAREVSDDRVALSIAPFPLTLPLPLDVRLAKRILEHEGGALTESDDTIKIELRTERGLVTLVD